MYVLYPVEYPGKSLPAQVVRTAWEKAGLDPRRVPAKLDPFGSDDVMALILAALAGTGGAPTPASRGNLELPDEKLPLLESLERFYLALYPEMKDADYLRSFHYERLEWLGEY